MSQPRAIYASERARLLFGQYRSGDANDPKTYVATIAAILSEYPAETIRHVTDPRTGIASNPPRDPKTGKPWTGMPNPGEVKAACEAHYGPIRRAAQREAMERRQLEEYERDKAALSERKSRKTYEELVELCAEKGLYIGPRRAKADPIDIDAFCAQHGVTREQFDAIPGAPSPKEKT